MIDMMNEGDIFQAEADDTPTQGVFIRTPGKDKDAVLGPVPDPLPTSVRCAHNLGKNRPHLEEEGRNPFIWRRVPVADQRMTHDKI